MSEMIGVERGDTVEWETIRDRMKGKSKIYRGVVQKIDGDEITAGGNKLYTGDVLYIRTTKKRERGNEVQGK